MARYLWTQREDFGPSPRFGHAMAYDSARSRLVLFGGQATDPFGDTWEWDGEFWTQMADTGPLPRSHHALCFDPVHKVVLLFGGTSGAAQGDTWSWDGEAWTQLEDSGPVPRFGHGMDCDTARSRAVLFGGDSGDGLLNDTWEWDGDAWTQQEDTGPSARKFHSLSFDLPHSQTVLFGGEGADGNGLGDTWQWNGTAWTQISSFGARPCVRAAIASSDVQVSLYGGINSENPPVVVFHDTWVFDGKHWSQRQDIGPGPRTDHAMAYDSARRRIVLFGGRPAFAPGGMLGDTWEHTESAAVSGGGLPPPGGGPTIPAGGVIAGLTIDPTTAAAGTQISANVMLAQPQLQATEVFLAFEPQSLFSREPNNIVHSFGRDVTILNIVNVPAGESVFTTAFTAPASNEPVVILATIGDQIQAIATLTIG